MAEPLKRAYALIDVKQMQDEDEMCVIEGIASTPTTDRMGDIVEPMGAKYALPMPLLMHHDPSMPVGKVTYAKPTKNGIPFKACIPRMKEAGRLKDRCDEAIQSVKAGIIRGVSIGFRSLEHSYMDGGGIKFAAWEWMELSLVAVPANTDATITAIKSADQAARRAASGTSAGRPVVRLQAADFRGSSPGVPAQPQRRKGAVYL